MEIGNVYELCAICGTEHEISVQKEKEYCLIKGENVEFEATFHLCKYTGESYETSLYIKENLLNARNSYRIKHKLLTSDEIKSVREYYKVSQKELSTILGWGDITIQRYETKAIQDETYDSILRRVLEEPLFLISELKSHKDKLEDNRYNEIYNYIKDIVKEEKTDYYVKREIETIYIDYSDESILNGFKVLDIDKVESVIAYLSNFIKPLYKVKLMKLLWYIDSEYYKFYDKSTTGLVYAHLPYGAVPLAHEQILKLKSINIVEEYNGDYIGYNISSNKNIDVRDFTISEIDVMNKVITKFKDFNTRNLVDYMHEEDAYLETKDNEIISYKYSKYIKDI